MRGADVMQEGLFAVRQTADYVPAGHPLVAIREILNRALRLFSDRSARQSQREREGPSQRLHAPAQFLLEIYNPPRISTRTLHLDESCALSYRRIVIVLTDRDDAKAHHCIFL